ncbi:SigE family RNA polymerase sigma factor [Carbonactinospora thermoautotrophica]|uniref:SigE family RNA polymerase sigma factor n=1 Tax=Carbonactinospora thermoautotrophica TaxID=1469144 RepID=UPI00226F3CA7|nr:SigE family RNA polymerase sigma factor [Carbonactinospora thermoautotrophica]MCX9193608.1 SigE family RNA polymerase sigma factor [Carbonactinospora thermoautotrophica]
MRVHEEADFREFVLARSHALRRTAYLLCGDWHQAEDIVQTALTRLYMAWRRVSRRDSIEGYVRQIIFRAYVDERRRGWSRRESPSDDLPDLPADEPGMAEERMVIFRALAKVPRRQRAVLVLRFWEDLRVEETAAVLGCSEGTVKSQTSRGLATLRALLGTPENGFEPTVHPVVHRERS